MSESPRIGLVTLSATDEEVDDLIARFRRELRMVWTVETLEFLAKGGRIGKAAAMAGQLLNIKPILGIEDGEVVPRKRVRGAHKAFLEFAEAFEAGSVDRPSLRVGIAHADAPERLEALRELVGRTRPRAQIEVETMLVTIANVPLIGLNNLLAPDASADDGLLDIAVYPGFSKAELAAYFALALYRKRDVSVEVGRRGK